MQIYGRKKKSENTTNYFKIAKVAMYSPSLYNELTLDSVSRNWKIAIHEIIHQTRETVFHWDIQNIEKRVENTTRSGVFLTKLEVFG